MDIRLVLGLCRDVEDRISKLHKREELQAYDTAMFELRLIRRAVFEVRQHIENSEQCAHIHNRRHGDDRRSTT